MGATSQLAAGLNRETSEKGRSHWPVILILGVIARLAVALVVFKFAAVPGLAGRGFENIAIALSLRAGHGYSSPFFSPSGPTAFMAPGYPLFLAAVMAVFGTGSAAATVVIALQEAFSLATIWLVMVAARHHFGQRTANLAGLICALAPPMLIGPILVWDTALTIFCMMGIFAAAAASVVPRMKFIPAGAACALAALLNPALIPSLWAICGWSAWKVKTIPWAGILAFLVVFSPWPLRNAVVMHAFIPLRTDFGYELWIGNHPGGNGSFEESMNPMMSVTERSEFVSRGELAYLREKKTLATTFIADHPAHFVALTMKRIGQFWSGVEAGTTTGSVTAPICILGAIGFALLWTRRSIWWLYLLPILLFPLPYYITHVYVRFQYVIDPLLVILAAHAVETFLYWLRPKSEPVLPHPLDEAPISGPR